MPPLHSVSLHLAGPHHVRQRAQLGGPQRVHHHPDQLCDPQVPDGQLGHRKQRVHAHYHGFQECQAVRLQGRLQMRRVHLHQASTIKFSSVFLSRGLSRRFGATSVGSFHWQAKRGVSKKYLPDYLIIVLSSHSMKGHNIPPGPAGFAKFQYRISRGGGLGGGGGGCPTEYNFYCVAILVFLPSL